MAATTAATVVMVSWVPRSSIGLTGLTAWPFAVDVKGWPPGGTALTRLRMSVSELDGHWRTQRGADDLHAMLPVGVVCAFSSS
jgi:hypothetical protein